MWSGVLICVQDQGMNGNRQQFELLRGQKCIFKRKDPQTHFKRYMMVALCPSTGCVTLLFVSAPLLLIFVQEMAESKNDLRHTVNTCRLVRMAQKKLWSEMKIVHSQIWCHTQMCKMFCRLCRMFYILIKWFYEQIWAKVTCHSGRACLAKH